MSANILLVFIVIRATKRHLKGFYCLKLVTVSYSNFHERQFNLQQNWSYLFTFRNKFWRTPFLILKENTRNSVFLRWNMRAIFQKHSLRTCYIVEIWITKIEADENAWEYFYGDRNSVEIGIICTCTQAEEIKEVLCFARYLRLPISSRTDKTWFMNFKTELQYGFLCSYAFFINVKNV